MKKKKTVQKSVYFTPETYNALCKFAKKENRLLSNAVNYIVEDWFRKNV